MEGSEAWQLHPAVRPQPGDGAIHKRHGSAFQDTPLAQELAAKSIGRLVICGLVTHGCVKAACQDALRLGYGVTLVSDGHSSFSKDADQLIQEWNRKLGEAGAAVVPAAEVDFTSL